jgi:hypothetical protein
MWAEQSVVHFEYVVAMVLGAGVNFYVSYATAHLVQWSVGSRHSKHRSLLSNQARFLLLFVAVVLSRSVVSRILCRLPLLVARPQWRTPQLENNFFSGWAYAVVLGSEMQSFFAT